MCEVLIINPKTYYKYRNMTDKDYDDYKLIKSVFKESMNTYGYRRIKQALLDKCGVIMNHKKIQRLMTKYGIRAEYVKTMTNYNQKYVDENRQPNLINRKFQQRGWVTDVTYLIFGNKRRYLSSILDLETRDVVSYEIGEKNNLDLVIKTLNKAIKKTKDLNGIIIHSDQGFQYLSNEYKEICVSNGILISMSRKATPLDNAVIESFHASLKKETLYNNDIKNINEYVDLVREWIKFYNTKRLRQKSRPLF